jgi:hypothetical protein
LLLDGVSGGEPDPNSWAAEFGLSYPIIGDHDRSIATSYINTNDGMSLIPNFTIFDRELNIQARYTTGSPDWALIDKLVAEEPPEVEYPMPSNAAALRSELGITEGSWIHPFNN